MTTDRKNRLAGEKSPYLLMHASNPVNWYPWGDEAFQEAKERDLPVFLSIGYAACHWCHVMEQECFSDKTVAESLNNNFICIKVDREERPDIDQVYMTVCQIMTGTGGWPLSIFLNFDREPFYAATYIPKKGRQGMPGMMELIPYLSDIWKNHRGEVNNAGKKLINAVIQVTTHHPDDFSEKTIHDAYASLSAGFDATYGGFSKSPKFPSVPQIFFLLKYYHVFSQKKAWEMVEITLRQMALSGIRDHLDGGFHRYATDREWKLPHFEKMLYDQALLAMAYAQSYQISPEPLFQTTGTGILDYVCAYLTDPEGRFWSSIDADSQEGEGAYYLWNYDEVMAVLGNDDGRLFCELYGITREGNVSGHGIASGSNVLHPGKNPLIALNDRRVSSPETWLSRMQEKLLIARSRRSYPAIDDKILTDWNGLMISALVQGFLTFGKRTYYDAAVRAARALQRTIIREDGSIYHHWHRGNTGQPGMSGDYIFLSQAFLDLFQVDGDITWMTATNQLMHQVTMRFWNPEKGGYYHSANDATDLPVRLMDLPDGAIPSVNGAAALLLERLVRVTGDKTHAGQYHQLMRIAGGVSGRGSGGMLSFLSAYMEKKTGFRIIALFSDQSAEISGLLEKARTHYLPGSVIIPVVDPLSVSSVIPEVMAYPRTPALHICGETHCYPPVTSVKEWEKWIADHEK